MRYQDHKDQTYKNWLEPHVAELTRRLGSDPIESYGSLYFDAQLNLLGSEITDRGDEQSVQHHPRWMAYLAEEAGASYVINFHNHPREAKVMHSVFDTLTAREDKEALEARGIEKLDDVIVGTHADGYYSFRLSRIARTCCRRPKKALARFETVPQ